MLRYVLATVAVVAVVVGPSAPASAIVECQEGDVQCYRTCYLPQYEKDRGVYWNNC